jgi:3-deoxy-7-phosphoheptulonate synthase
VLLKRGMAATLAEFVFAAEYILLEGAPGVVLCERGIRSPEPSMRNTLDLAAVPALRHQTNLSVIVDPSHATGRRELVPPMTRAAAAAGADGVMIEIHDAPDQALCDGKQAVHPDRLAALVENLRKIAALAAEAEESQ